MLDQEIYSTGQVAQICRVHLQTVIKWCDSEKIKNYKTPGGNRKVLKKDLQTFLDENNIPLDQKKQNEKRLECR